MLALQIEKNHKYTGSFQTELTVQDVINMCAIPENQQPFVKYQLQSEPSLKFAEGKILVPDCNELIKQAAFYRKKCGKGA